MSTHPESEFSKRFTHPIHARGVRSPWPDAQVGKALTDKKIHTYALRGVYGTEAQAAARAADAAPPPKPRNTLKKLLTFLEDLCREQN